MMPKNFMQQIREDIESKREGNIPSRHFTKKMFNLLKRSKFNIYVKSAVNLQSGIEIISEDAEQTFVVYRLKEIQEVMNMKNQKRIDEYG